MLARTIPKNKANGLNPRYRSNSEHSYTSVTLDFGFCMNSLTVDIKVLALSPALITGNL